MGSSSGVWLEKALVELCDKKNNSGPGLGLELDSDLISGLVSYCECASPLDAKEYLDVTHLVPFFLNYFIN